MIIRFYAQKLIIPEYYTVSDLRWATQIEAQIKD